MFLGYEVERGSGVQRLTRLLSVACSDAISYEKGAAVLKMLSDMIGQDKLIQGT